ncbi:MAG: acyl carrier protein [Clostridiales bacterium]|jgi:acyl carrier protein|nr:acyl carrier protein [Clostridiales bacterium]
MVFEKVRQILAEHKGIEPESITMESTFESLGLDSLDTVELLMQFEDEFGVTLQADDSLRNVGDFVKLIEGSK